MMQTGGVDEMLTVEINLSVVNSHPCGAPQQRRPIYQMFDRRLTRMDQIQINQQRNYFYDMSLEGNKNAVDSLFMSYKHHSRNWIRALIPSSCKCSRKCTDMIGTLNDL